MGKRHVLKDLETAVHNVLRHHGLVPMDRPVIQIGSDCADQCETPVQSIGIGVSFLPYDQAKGECSCPPGDCSGGYGHHDPDPLMDDRVILRS